ncbi:flap endonuclease Xni [Ferrimonas sp. SCSIO 43195]|uniref:flap endonuclease Xni n=1 Tax=Ferrimonas sp. SCSIO 43195 TaxID=2822844 RepID=UPI0020755B0B|nr:flap endonuclease Xni [Ferrimonas sp. SCSIO 43195]USD38274.1 flap endonuclease Xni [Ferrimonas sp. SCSIO 43195]
MPATALLIDALNLIRRIYAAVPDGDTDALYQRTQAACQKMVRQHQATHVVMVWDGDNSHLWRQSLYPDYKAHRSPMPEPLAATLPDLKANLAKLGIRSLACDGIEADDVMATLCHKIERRGGRVILASTDKGFVQLHSDNVSQWHHFDQCWLDRDYFLDRFQMPPERMLEYWSLAGDSGNGIPGIAGIGAKTAHKLLSQHPIQALFTEGTIEGKLGQKLIDGHEQAQLSYKLAKLRTQLSLSASLSQFRVSAPTT